MGEQTPTPEDRDEKVSIPLDPEDALRALLAVKPDSESKGEGGEGRPDDH